MTVLAPDGMLPSKLIRH